MNIIKHMNVVGETFCSQFSWWTECTWGAGEGSLQTNHMQDSPSPWACRTFSRLSSSALLLSAFQNKSASSYLCSLVSCWDSFHFLISAHIKALDCLCVWLFSAAYWIAVSNPVLQIAWLRFVFAVFLWNCDSQCTPLKQNPLSPWDWEACFKNKL